MVLILKGFQSENKSNVRNLQIQPWCKKKEKKKKEKEKQQLNNWCTTGTFMTGIT